MRPALASCLRSRSREWRQGDTRADAEGRDRGQERGAPGFFCESERSRPSSLLQAMRAKMTSTPRFLASSMSSLLFGMTISFIRLSADRASRQGRGKRHVPPKPRNNASSSAGPGAAVCAVEKHNPPIGGGHNKEKEERTLGNISSLLNTR